MKNKTLDRIEDVIVVLGFGCMIIGGILFLTNLSKNMDFWFGFKIMVVGYIIIASGSLFFPSNFVWGLREKMVDYDTWIQK